MKKLLIAFLFTTTAFFIASCDTTQESAEETVEVVQEVPEGMTALDLSTHAVVGLPLILNVPANSGTPEIIEGTAGATQVHAGKNFHVEIMPSTGDISAKKDEINNNGTFQVEWITDEPELLIYTYAIEGSEFRQHHFYVLKNINGRSYEVSDVPPSGEEYSEAAIRSMATAAQSLRPKQEPS